MINIQHPRVVTKPPISNFAMSDNGMAHGLPMQRCNSAEDRVRNSNPSRFCETNGGLDSKKGEYLKEAETHPNQINAMIENIGYDLKKLQTTSDFNQNVIEPNSCSFDQLCSMINDLEKNLSGNEAQLNIDSNTTGSFVNNEGGHFYGNDQDYSINQLQPEKDYSNQPCGSSLSTYEDIMSLLGILNHEGYLEDVPNNRAYAHPKNIEATLNSRSIPCCNNQGIHPAQTHIPETIKDDLATLRLQLEERDETLKILKNELKSQRHSACEKLELQKKQHCTELQTQKTKYQTTIKRHQKFIEQIISDKKNLTEKCNSLTEHIKEMEVKYHRELKVVADRHAVELRRARELCAASEKIRRERWLEAKTSKIKEMTVKGLEPELRSMVEQHQQELQEIRSAHIKELQDTELRTIRRSNQQLEQLRLELTASHEKLLSSEKDILRTRYQEKLEQQENLFQEQRRKLLDDLEREKNLLAQEHKRLNAERDAAISQARSQFNEKINTLIRQHQIEKKAVQESLRVEQETWMENCRRQHNMKLEKMETRLRDECNRERDRQIELAIERLEKETLDMKTSLQQSSENRLRCMREKYEAELQDLNNSKELLTSKVTSVQERLTETTTQLQITEGKLQQCMIQLSNSKQSVDQLTIERDDAKKIVRKEIEMEKRELENKIASLHRELTENNSNRDVQMAQLYSRVKLIVTQKDLAIGKFAKEIDEAKKRCDHLEKLLDQQRKDYVLQSL
ncbi:centrosomal protein of 131 kDa [Neodiprion fabricii]|uniref:centrosomal protein of 131 kDa n=1 Tax=Neodiprion fabricii TaxID=2872261 RepID=UPI001ED8F6ED|nr:centrosomal protein of 131 kDa [Neodiprion fabricii]